MDTHATKKVQLPLHRGKELICMWEIVQKLIAAVSDTVWGSPMLLLLIGCGVYLSVRLRFIQISKFRLWTHETFGKLLERNEKRKGQITPYQAVASALASSIGTGNIVGVATAISAGGAGAVFWMWISAFFGMALKYTEIFLAVRFRREKHGQYIGGPMYYIESGLGKGYKWLAVLFSVSGAFACLGMGAMNQSNAIAGIAKEINIPEWMTALLATALAAMAISGGISRIARLSEKIVPIMAIAYILGGICVVAIAPSDAWRAVKSIFQSALTPVAVYGAAAGEMVKRGLRYGVARGVFSNEAGLGSAPLVHASANAKSPMHQGFWGMFEVFVDTVLICTVTAIVILSADIPNETVNGAGLVALSFSKYLGKFGGIFVGVSTVLFALSTIFGWSYYGERCVMYLTNERIRSRYIYRIIFIFSVFIGAVMGIEQVWQVADMFNGMMMIPNLIAVILLSETVIKETKI